MSTNVVAFPLRPRRVDPGLARLNLALDALVHAMEHQKTVAREYCRTVKTLDSSVQDLGGNLRRYGGALSSLDAAVLVVRDESRRLADSMDRACAA